MAKAIQLLKGNSSKWIREAFPKMRSFAWQEGYGAFSFFPALKRRAIFEGFANASRVNGGCTPQIL
jgi:hypothetical protein